MNQPVSPYLLYHLPDDLKYFVAKCFFTVPEAAKVLTVDTFFHSLFLPRVWHTLDNRFFDSLGPDDIEKRIQYCTKNGHHVRVLNALTARWFHFNINIKQLFPKITSFSVYAHHVFLQTQTVALDAIAELSYLRDLSIHFKLYPYRSEQSDEDLEQLANCINRNDSLNKIALECGLVNTESWSDIVKFVQQLEPARRHGLQITVPTTTFPSSEHAADLAPYITVFSPENTPNECMAAKYRDFFGGASAAAAASAAADNSRITKEVSWPVFSSLSRICLTPCCSVPSVYDFSDFNAARFPALGALEFKDCAYFCHRSDDSKYEHLPQYRLPLLHWPNLHTLIIECAIFPRTVLQMANANPQLKRLVINLGLFDPEYPELSGGDSIERAFQFDALLPLLPQLAHLDIGGQSIVFDAANLDEDKRLLMPQRRLALRFTNGSFITDKCLKFIFKCIPGCTSLWLKQAGIHDLGSAIKSLREITDSYTSSNNSGMNHMVCGLVT
ncbi:hypothetical protein GQ42DRAFT_151922 [Ramicandelaber brevisporus]|nr:hypothetical protein GQ42DRAFT_151922 [Ramicandelaber brevisporus]